LRKASTVDAESPRLGTTRTLRFCVSFGEVDLAAHLDLGGRAAHAELLDRHQAVVDLGVGGDAVELEPLGEYVAKVERQAPRQRLQAHQGHQLAQAGIDLEELAVLGLHLHVAGQARVIDFQNGSPFHASEPCSLACRP